MTDPDPLTVIADGERLLAAWRTTRGVEDFDQFVTWWERNADALLAVARAAAENVWNIDVEEGRDDMRRALDRLTETDQ